MEQRGTNFNVSQDDKNQSRIFRLGMAYIMI